VLLNMSCALPDRHLIAASCCRLRHQPTAGRRVRLPALPVALPRQRRVDKGARGQGQSQHTHKPAGEAGSAAGRDTHSGQQQWGASAVLRLCHKPGTLRTSLAGGRLVKDYELPVGSLWVGDEEFQGSCMLPSLAGEGYRQAHGRLQHGVPAVDELTISIPVELTIDGTRYHSVRDLVDNYLAAAVARYQQGPPVSTLPAAPSSTPASPVPQSPLRQTFLPSPSQHLLSPNPPPPTSPPSHPAAAVARHQRCSVCRQRCTCTASAWLARHTRPPDQSCRLATPKCSWCGTSYGRSWVRNGSHKLEQSMFGGLASTWMCGTWCCLRSA
jgi:hypothetical protein